jgi:hypothetical protein
MPTANELYAYTPIPQPPELPRPPQVAIDNWFAAAVRRGGDRLTDRVKGVDFTRYGVAAVVIGVAVVAGADAAWAQSSNTNDLSGVATRLQTGLKLFPNVVAVLAQIFGFFWALMAAMALKKAGAEDDRNPQEAKKALFNMIAGVMAIGLPAALGMGAQTFFGGTDRVINDPSQGIQIR